ncbi:ABC transporter ATP-binding protein [Rhabdothermincola salaria]|uniref:ABC transporter ATP-binding protein n=1 Tax=Rhabdothermincola salaria TaxID=2903142 RepID=UPI001E4D46FC|nr:ABC transporter ATP-binding protein [Rhabdothermincola salaria]MCD9625544.1 ABC transporter ATP-binding protein [Rhabdothermincola salaria]
MAERDDPLVLRVEGLVRRFGDRVAVDGVSFAIAPGETYGLLGPNGAGKTTTISMVAGVLGTDAGTITVAGHTMGRGDRQAKAAIGLVPQDVALYPDLSATENLRFFGRLQGLDGRALDARITEVLDVVGLTDRAADRVDAYSGGMKRRANIAVGLLHRPRLLILDEPTVGVDPQSRNQILESIEVLGGEGLAVLYTTHYMEEAERLCDRVGIIDDGRLVAEGTRAQLVERIGSRESITVQVLGDGASVAERCRLVTGVVAADLADATTVTVVAVDAAAVLSEVVEAVHDAGTSITGVEIDEPDLEDVFLQLTGKALRDRA